MVKSCIGEEGYTMSTAHEVLDLLHWLDGQRETLLRAVKENPTTSEVPTWMHAATEQVSEPTEEQEIAVDEP